MRQEWLEREIISPWCAGFAHCRTLRPNKMMKILEADGSLRLPLPPELRHGKLKVEDFGLGMRAAEEYWLGWFYVLCRSAMLSGRGWRGSAYPGIRD